MKINITITEVELQDTINAVYVDPCINIDCADIDCDNCPLQVVAEEYRKAQDKFVNKLKSFSVE